MLQAISNTLNRPYKENYPNIFRLFRVSFVSLGFIRVFIFSFIAR